MESQPTISSNSWDLASASSRVERHRYELPSVNEITPEEKIAERDRVVRSLLLRPDASDDAR